MSRRNPFNAAKPAEWATMSKKMRKRWNRSHWQPSQYLADLSLRREATRKSRRGSAGAGMEQLAQRIAKATNPSQPTTGPTKKPWPFKSEMTKSEREWVRIMSAPGRSKKRNPPTALVEGLAARRDALARKFKEASDSQRPTIKQVLKEVDALLHSYLADYRKTSALSMAAVRAAPYRMNPSTASVSKLRAMTDRINDILRKQRESVHREARKWSSLGDEERRRIDREERADELVGHRSNPRRKASRRSKSRSRSRRR